MKRVAISTLGCKTNQFESAAMIEQLQTAGYLMVPFSQTADIYIINSCTVTARTDAETRRLIRRARRLNPDARIVATGCYAQVAPGELEKMPELDSVLGNQEKQQIAAMIESTGHSVSNITDIKQDEPLKLTSFAEHTRAFLQVQNGCNSFCSYCIVPYARGRSRSVTPDEALNEILNLTANGYKEVVLTGIHLGAYGLDLPIATSLTALVKRIDSSKLVPRLRIGSIEPNEVSEELLDLMAQSSVLCQHLHLPLQSGSNSVLQRMGRRYDTGDFRALVARITSIMPDTFIGADVIAGFPGESDAEFQETVDLIKNMPFSDLHVFPYSSRPGTMAASMPHHVPSQTIKERAGILRTVAEKKKQVFLERFTGKELTILVQGYNPATGICRGLSRNYLTASFPGDNKLVNEEVTVKIAGCDGEVCSGIRTL
ncbi:MAG: tRNA (N(6)-L-threonylcarbamoyladenosine(37)-C(2))-methylthiotransferase MtaB [Desulfuromonadaceae bacterium]|nr:tRNA (N(6)-L-threonylcarbamoyladenosine(37)-C(2))-methylthiotransferase MtaB [Desulfuromonadaceae bacterium]MDD5107747.1 tRNA (N(6)-L-threonylcarbamoyladenosine(37)-C(2))-methylthiotransferase MtaB [Desulfuromonadaceae bacterium]